MRESRALRLLFHLISVGLYALLRLVLIHDTIIIGTWNTAPLLPILLMNFCVLIKVSVTSQTAPRNHAQRPKNVATHKILLGPRCNYFYSPTNAQMAAIHPRRILASA